MKIKIVNKSTNGLPKYETENAAGMDIKSNTDAALFKPMERALISTGLFVEIPVGFEGQLRAKSGVSIKKGLTLVNAVGTIDSDFRGEIKVPIINLSTENQMIMRGDKIAQLVIVPIVKAELEEVESVQELSQTGRGEGGFGSTGV